MKRTQDGFTIIELLVVVSIIALLIGILLPAIGKARDQAKLAKSQANLRNLVTAMATYAGEWNDRQLTFVDDNLARYGADENNAYRGTGLSYYEQNGVDHPPMILGWSEGGLWAYWMKDEGNWGLCQPIVFPGGPDHVVGFGAFRMINCRQFSQYISGKFYDPIYYAPKDKIVLSMLEQVFDHPGEFDPSLELAGGAAIWSSYCMSPAAMFSPDVFRNANACDWDGTACGWQNPWDIPGGFRSPTMGSALYPDMKTMMLEHHWLQNTRIDCNPGWSEGTYDGCEPFYFNHAWESVPMTAFYDGHIEGLGTREAIVADKRMLNQTKDLENAYGLWSRDTPFLDNGYFINLGYDWSATSFHILTTDGIRGRDKLPN
jgi:prepilin-type N-terminal cleavage/methylation domain-containing protein